MFSKAKTYKNHEDFHKLFPQWFSKRLMDDEWHFGILTTEGTVFEVCGIDAIHITPIGKWIDCRLTESDSYCVADDNILKKKIVSTSVSGRPYISINIDNVVSIFELANT
jgi:hypothetical protein